MYHILITPKVVTKAQNFLRALHYAAQQKALPVSVGPSYRDCKMLLMYGMGGPDRLPIAKRHMQPGKTLVAFDLGYWERTLPINQRKFRVAIDGFHPKDVMQGAAPSNKRWIAAGLDIAPDRAPVGPIMLVGNAPKSVAAGAGNWTVKKSRELRSQFPGVRILYRPKPKRPHEVGVMFDELSTGPIESELSRVSLVVCRHSNVAVDACRLGVPVVCDDGAAACIYPQSLQDYQNQPGFDRRREFLHRLAYWQWSANEANQFWDWLFSAFPAYRY